MISLKIPLARHRQGLLALVTAGIVLSPSSGVAATVRRYALIVGNNLSLDPGTRPLSFADDDAAQYYEVLKAAGGEVKLHAVLDAEAQQRFPGAAAAAQSPTSGEISRSLETLYKRIREARDAGVETHFYFIYSGHGNVGAGHEGYINLLDAKLYRKELYRRIVAPSPAAFNHLVIDACHAYYLVNKRGRSDKEGDYGDAVRAFLENETLAKYPNTGVILAASSRSETHEWSLWQSGVFSHELRSALLGAADADQDGRVTYDEAAACIEAANAAVKEPAAKLRVYYRPPPLRQGVALIVANEIPRHVRISAASADRYYVEDSRGVRQSDFHFTGEGPVTVALVGQGPHYLHRGDNEAVVQHGIGDVDGRTLSFRPSDLSKKGSLDETFRRKLYETAFGLSFLRGFVSAHGKALFELPASAPESSEIVDEASTKRSSYCTAAWVSAGATVFALGGGGVLYGLGRKSYHDYTEATTRESAASLRRETSRTMAASRAVLISGAVFAVASALLFYADARDNPTVQVGLVPTSGGVLMAIGTSR